MTEDSRRYHRHAAPERVRFYGKNQQSQSVTSPFGALPMRTAGAVSRQAVQPLLQGLGLGVGRRAQRLQSDITSGRAQGPLASAIRQIQQYAPGVIGGATDIGRRVAGQGEQAVNALQTSITGAEQMMPEWMQATREGLGAARQGLTGAQDLYSQYQAMLPGLQQTAAQGTAGAQSALDLARGAAQGPALTGAQDALTRAQELLRGGSAQTGAQSAVDLAQRYAQQAASPIQGEDLYQAAARRVMQQVQPGLAARGLEAGGAGAQAMTDAQRNLAYQFAADQAAQRQASLQGLTGATSNLGNLQQGAISGVNQAAGNVGNITQQGITGLEGAAQGVQQAAQGQAALGQSMLPYLQGLQQGAQGIQSAAQQGGQMAMMGPQLAGMQANAVQQLGQTLMQQYGLPMQATGQLLNILTGGVQPGLALTQATAPITTSSGKGMNIL